MERQLKTKVVTELSLTQTEKDLLKKGQSFVIGPPAKQKRLRIEDEICDELEKGINKVWEILTKQITGRELKRQTPTSLSYRYLNPRAASDSTVY